MAEFSIRAENLSKHYRLVPTTGRGWRRNRKVLTDELANLASRFRPEGKKSPAAAFVALQDISFEARPQDIIGVIGHNGAGKSTLLKILSRVTVPTSGRAVINGRVGSLLEVGTGFHSELTGRENIFIAGAIIGMNRAEIRRKFDEIVEFAEVREFLDTPVKRYSSGMEVRLAFSVAAHLEPEVLLVDEVLAVGDAAFQKKSIQKIMDVARSGSTVLFVSHNMTTVSALCSKVLVLHHGHLTYPLGPAEGGISHYLSLYDLVPGRDSAVLDPSDPGAACRITHFQVLDENGFQVEAPTSGAPALLKLQFTCAPDVDPRTLELQLQFKTGTGMVAASCARFLPAGQAGQGAVICRIARFPFMPGNMRISGLVMQAGMPVAQYEDLYLGRVDRGGALRSMDVSPTQGIIDLFPEWLDIKD